jgi:chondroitin AC lyase
VYALRVHCWLIRGRLLRADGAIFTTNVLVLENYAQGTTNWTIPDTQFDLFSHLVLDGQAKSSRGANFDFLSCGRLFTYFSKHDQYGVNQGHYHYFAAFTPFELAFPTFKPPFTTPIGVFFAPLLGTIGKSHRNRAPEFAQLALRLQGDIPDESTHTHFYDSDYTVYHRPEYAVFVHSMSTRTLPTECVNKENKKGRMMADGTTTIYTRGDQYEAVFPLLNWTLLPGTTEVQNTEQDRESPAHECGAIRNGDIRKSFVGGLSDGGVGVSAMDFARAHVEAFATTVDNSTAGLSGCNASMPQPQPGMHCPI